MNPKELKGSSKGRLNQPVCPLTTPFIKSFMIENWSSSQVGMVPSSGLEFNRTFLLHILSPK